MSKVVVEKAFGTHKKGDELKNMHPDTAKNLEEKGLVKIVEKESKKGNAPTDYAHRKDRVDG